MDTLLFCRACGSFRDIADSGNGVITCQQCKDKVHINDVFLNIKNKVEKIPIERSELLLSLYGRSLPQEKGKEAVIEEDCPKCGYHQLSYHTAQLRGIDEGQTIFYTCMSDKCKHKFTVNS